jgi:acetoin:2,6-dichlorophenolindophenol oxidoreductase subunit beta
VLDLRTLSPLDWDSVFDSVEATGRLLALDAGALTGSVAGEIVARVSERCWGKLKCAPRRLGMPDVPEPTSFGLTRGFHPGAREIVVNAAAMLKRDLDAATTDALVPKQHDIPGEWFKGPF